MLMSGMGSWAKDPGKSGWTLGVQGYILGEGGGAKVSGCTSTAAGTLAGHRAIHQHSPITSSPEVQVVSLWRPPAVCPQTSG